MSSVLPKLSADLRHSRLLVLCFQATPVIRVSMSWPPLQPRFPPDILSRPPSRDHAQEMYGLTFPPQVISPLRPLASSVRHEGSDLALHFPKGMFGAYRLPISQRRIILSAAGY